MSPIPPPPAPIWRLSDPTPEAHLRALQEGLSLPRALCDILVQRVGAGISEAKAFLRPLLDDLPQARAMAGMDRAVERILEAIHRGETILVHGDYDVDGISGTALLARWLRRLGGRVHAFVPHRNRDGYDLGEAGLARAREVGARLLITVDSGIHAHEAVAEAGRAGIDVVVTDHHTPGESLPPALAVLDPNRSDCPYPNKDLCGAGIAFRLAGALGEEEGVPAEEWHELLDLVALATVADLVPLTGENRTLVRYGLRALARTPRPGVRALVGAAGLEGREIEAGTVGFVLAPRINAAGRVGEAESALRLLLTDDPEEARVLASELEELNRLRQSEDRRIYAEALDLLEREFDPATHRAVVLASEGWNPGVIGIVASRVMERVHRPTVLIALQGSGGRGSARSLAGLHLYEALRRCAPHLDRFGGHARAAGFDLRRERVEPFAEAFREEAARVLGPPEELRPTLRAEVEVSLRELDDELHHFLRYVGPFGIGNPRPVFVARGVRLSGPRRVGDDHLKLRIEGEGTGIGGIGFGLAQRIAPEGLDGGVFDVAFQLRRNEYRGVSRLQAHLLDLRPSVPAP